MTDKKANLNCKSLVVADNCSLNISKTSSATMYQERFIRDMPLLSRTVYLYLISNLTMKLSSQSLLFW